MIIAIIAVMMSYKKLLRYHDTSLLRLHGASSPSALSGRRAARQGAAGTNALDTLRDWAFLASAEYDVTIFKKL
jgi:hypothetical protein